VEREVVAAAACDAMEDLLALLGLAFVVVVVVVVVVMEEEVEEEDGIALLLVGLPEEEVVVAGDEVEEEEEVVGLLLPLDFVLVVILVLEVTCVDEVVIAVVDLDTLPGLPALPVEELEMLLDEDIELGEDDMLDDLAGLLPAFVELVVAIDDNADVVLELVVAEAEVEVTFQVLLFEPFPATLEVVLTPATVELVVGEVGTITGLPFFFTSFAPQMPALATGAPISALR